jgi:Phage protein (N4 Gp49/phage Sf6 gene 66) family
MEPEITLAEAKQIVSEKTRRKITEESIKARIFRVSYIYDDTTTICMITMNNGFRVIGHATPADPGNYDAAVGRRYAYENAFRQLWQLEGYLLVEYLSLEAMEGKKDD